MKEVVLVGATSHVAKSLIGWNLERKRWNLTLVARRPEIVDAFVRGLDSKAQTVCRGFESLDSIQDFDAIINCVGFGTPQKVRSAGIDLFQKTEEIDNKIIALLSGHPSRKYVSFSSGAVYGSGMDGPVGPEFRSEIDLSPLKQTEFYRITKIYQEAKHRACPDLAIVDVRLFSFFSRFIDPESGYLMTDVLESLRTGHPLNTGAQEIYRDYISPEDLYTLVDRIIESPPFNGTLDTVSAGFVSKTELLRALSLEFGLQVNLVPGESQSPTGTKQYYYSENKGGLAQLGYLPRWNSWEGIRNELHALQLPVTKVGS